MYFEGVNNLIAAESESQLNMATRQAFGFKENPTSKWREKIQEIKAIINAEIEFSSDFDSGESSTSLKRNR